MNRCIVLGSRSEIAKGLTTYLKADGWEVAGWHRNTILPDVAWNLVICALGTVAPVEHWTRQPASEWDHSIRSNLVLPIQLLRGVWDQRQPDAKVCFMAGANPQRAGPNYSAYYAGKMGLLKAIETIDYETPDATFFALAPGIVYTKIHQPTYDSGIVNPGLEDRKAKGGTPMIQIYEALKWCLAQPKDVVGGRNICVSDPLGAELAARLKANPSMYKLRRIE